MLSFVILTLLTCVPGADGKSTCDAKSSDTKVKGTLPANAAASTKAPQSLMARGEKLKGLTAVSLDALLSTPSSFDGKDVQVEGKVRKACEKKGCWMELAADDRSPGIRVTFKNYGFFVPLDSAGSTAKVEGTVKVTELPVERAKHYEAEGATVPKDKEGKYREVQLVALGVELRR
jgi:hypothetical protein